MDATAWLRLVGSYTPEPLHGPKLARVLALAPRFDAEFPHRAFTADTARKVGKALPDTLPTYDAIAGALRFAMPAEAEAPSAAPAQAPRERFPVEWVADRLRAGADRKHVLSLVRTYNTPEGVRAVMAAHYPEELRAEEARAAEVRRDKARAAEHVAKAVGNALRAPPLHAAPAATGQAPRQADAWPPRQSLVPPVLMLRKLEAAIAAGDATDATRTAAVSLRARLEADAKRLLRELNPPREEPAA